MTIDEMIERLNEAKDVIGDADVIGSLDCKLQLREEDFRRLFHGRECVLKEVRGQPHYSLQVGESIFVAVGNVPPREPSKTIVLEELVPA